MWTLGRLSGDLSVFPQFAKCLSKLSYLSYLLSLLNMQEVPEVVGTVKSHPCAPKQHPKLSETEELAMVETVYKSKATLASHSSGR